jgi:hypothetical protein
MDISENIKNTETLNPLELYFLDTLAELKRQIAQQAIEIQELKQKSK